MIPGGGGGHSQCILVGVCRSTSKKGGHRHGHNPKKGVLGTAQPKKRGVLGTGTSRKRGVLRTGIVKKTILVTDVAQKGVFGSLFINYPYFFLVNMINWWGFTLTD